MKKNNSKWVLTTALRYLFTKRKEKGHVAALLSILGIAVGVMTLIIVLSVMNGFQHNYIDNINEVISYHLRLDRGGEELSPEDWAALDGVPGITAAVPFIDFQTTLRGEYSEPDVALIRGVPIDVRETDPSFTKHLSIESGEFDLSEPGSIVLGAQLAMSQGVFPGDRVTLLSLAGQGLSRLSLQEQEFTVTGTVRCGYLEYDRTLGFISLDSARSIMGEDYLVYGLKTSNINREERWKKGLEELYADSEELRISTWKEYNVAFFDALRMEKVMMFLVVSLVFLVVAVNIFHSLKRSVSERMEEIALLKSMGASPVQVQGIFLLEGLYISLAGVGSGLILGLSLALNINEVFDFVEMVVNGVMGLFRSSGISIYSSMNYYLVEVPVLIMPWDLIFIGGAAVLLSLGGAWLASAPVAEIQPAEVLNIE
ncbi:MAG: ABC transporter permease [Spirochaetales bacterium]|nr:ABC transporter permease [Spirochaetales bacterium]